MQTTPDILMVRPAFFGGNPETLASNIFQKASPQSPEEQKHIHEKALTEFDALVSLLRKNDVNVLVYEDSPEPHKPDAIFPNNWLSTHSEGTIILYPLQAPSRRAERRQDIIDSLKTKFVVRHVLDLSHNEEEGLFLEGTGSMVLDRTYQLAYIALSSRTKPQVLDQLCNLMMFRGIIFEAEGPAKEEIYHTNVLMSVGDKFVIVCMDILPFHLDVADLLASFKQTQKEVIKISYDQVLNFAGNVLEIQNQKGEKLVVMSTRAYQAFNSSQIKQIERYARILHSPLDTIETYGGGSARCMMAEIFLAHL